MEEAGDLEWQKKPQKKKTLKKSEFLNHIVVC